MTPSAQAKELMALISGSPSLLRRPSFFRLQQQHQLHSSRGPPARKSPSVVSSENYKFRLGRLASRRRDGCASVIARGSGRDVRKAGLVRAQGASSWEALPSVAAASLSLSAALAMGVQLRKTQLEVLGGGSALNGSLLSKLTELERDYKPFPLLTNRHVETIFAALFRSLPKLTFRRECLLTADGGTVALDWPLPEVTNPQAVLVLLPGLTGGSDDTYVQHLARRAASHGCVVVVFNSRGCAGSPVATRQCHGFGYKTVDGYYFDASSSRSIKDVKVPVLRTQAKTDPIAPERGIPRAEIEANPNCLLVVTPYGGHFN